MLIECAVPFRRGDVIEIRRGPVCVIARVVWATDTRFGVRSQDRIDAEGLIRADNTKPRHAADGSLVERRAKMRADPAVDHERSRALARASQFAGLAAFAASGAIVIMGLLWSLLQSMTGAISTALL